MKKTILLIFLTFTFIFTGCANKEFTQVNIGEIKVMYKGTVTYTKTVEIKDSGEGALFGTIIGAIIGHQFGRGIGKGAATITGAIAGGVIGNQLNKDLGQEVWVDLENGQKVTTIIRVDKKNPYWLKPGDRVMVYARGNRIVRIVPIFNEKVQ